ncbi:MAG TPA: hypothetical protein VLC53_05770 [Myxococcota bacterium]|nr:hypothetical protein [Myxococcota bacterium]
MTEIAQGIRVRPAAALRLALAAAVIAAIACDAPGRASPADPAPLEGIAIYGQSNATGQGRAGPTPPVDVAESEGVSWRASDTGEAPRFAWAPARDHVRYASHCRSWPACRLFSPWPSFVRHRVDALGVETRTVLIPTAVSASSLVRGGRSEDGFLAVGRPGYQRHLAIIAAAEAAGPYRFRTTATLMDQGGADGNARVSYAEYLEAARAFTDAEERAGRAVLWADAIRRPPPVIASGWEPILQATRALIDQHANAFRGPPLWDLEVEADGIHRGGQALAHAGARWAEYYHAFRAGNEPPRITDVRVAGVSVLWPLGADGAGEEVRVAAAGDAAVALDLVVIDPEGDPISYRWEVYTENEVADCRPGSRFSAPDVEDPSWTPAGAHRTCWLRVEARDARAGDVALVRVDVTGR